MENLKKLREEAQLSQQNLADRLSMSQQAVFKYEHDLAEPDFTTLIGLADLFHTSIDYLIGYTDNPAAPDFRIDIRPNSKDMRHLAAYHKLDERYAKCIDELMSLYNEKKSQQP